MPDEKKPSGFHGMLNPPPDAFELKGDDVVSFQITEITAETQAKNYHRCWWLSFCDPDKPEGEQFLGVIITEASTFGMAHLKINMMGINPGGEVIFQEIPMGMNDIRHHDRLLSKSDLRKAGYMK